MSLVEAANDFGKTDDARAILRAVYGRVSKREPAMWLTPDVIEGAEVRFIKEGHYSETRKVVVCRHEDWKNICHECDWIVTEMKANEVSFEQAVERRAKVKEETAKAQQRMDEQQAIEDAEAARDADEEEEKQRTLKLAEDEYYAKVIETPETGEVEEVVEVISDEYRARQQDSFNRVGGGPAGWTACEVKDIAPNGEVIYDVPKDYKEVTPYTDTFGPRPDSDQCELCGHWILYPCPIKNDVRKSVMWVGSECVNAFKGAGYVTKQIKKFRDSKLRKAFEEWQPTAIKECEKHRMSNRDWLDYPYFKFRKSLSQPTGVHNLTSAQAIAKELSSRRIVNFFKKAKKLGIPIPENVLIEPKEQTNPNP